MASIAPGGPKKGFVNQMFARKSVAQVQRETASSGLNRPGFPGGIFN